MLSDEEKQAMKYFYNLRATIDESNMLFDEDIDVKCGKETIKQITTILNLIEKQSKEIEKYKNVIDNREFTWKQKYEETFEYVKENFINQDKIKAKIEELEKQDKESRFSKNYLVIHVLQSLLEEDK